jgi:hypothetical protein
MVSKHESVVLANSVDIKLFPKGTLSVFVDGQFTLSKIMWNLHHLKITESRLSMAIFHQCIATVLSMHCIIFRSWWNLMIMQRIETIKIIRGKIATYGLHYVDIPPYCAWYLSLCKIMAFTCVKYVWMTSKLAFIWKKFLVDDALMMILVRH